MRHRSRFQPAPKPTAFAIPQPTICPADHIALVVIPPISGQSPVERCASDMHRAHRIWHGRSDIGLSPPRPTAAARAPTDAMTMLVLCGADGVCIGTNRTGSQCRRPSDVACRQSGGTPADCAPAMPHHLVRHAASELIGVSRPKMTDVAMAPRLRTLSKGGNTRSAFNCGLLLHTSCAIVERC